MRKKLLHGIDMKAPGGVEKLLGFHRLTFGDAVMEAGSEDGGTAAAGESNDQGGEYKAPATQADLDRIVGDRLARERTKFADYDDLKAKAGQVDEFQTRIGVLETENGDLATKVQGYESATERAGIVADIAKATGIPANALRGDTREDLQAHADVLKELYKPTAPVIHGQESAPGKIQASAASEFVGKLFKS